MTLSDGKKQNSVLQEVKYVAGNDTDIQKFTPKNGIKSDTPFLCFTMYLGLLPLVMGGGELVWISSAYTSLISNNSDINPLDGAATTTDISLLGGLPTLISLIGPIFMINLSDKIGRKLFLQINAFGLFICNIGQAFSTFVTQLIIIRCFLFLFLNLYSIVIQVYISEICENHNKAKYLCMMGICLPLGNFYAYWFGPILTYRTYTHILGAPILPFLCLFFFAPESPVYLLSKGKIEECKQILKKLRNNKNLKELEMDFNQLVDTINISKSSRDKSIRHLFKTKEAKVGVLLTVLLALVQHGCGMSTITCFLGPLLVAAGTNLAENVMTVTVAIVQIISVLSTSLIIDKIGRRKLLIASCIGCGIPFFAWGLFYYLKEQNSGILPYIQWLPLTCVIISTLVFSLGLGPVPMAIVSEIFPSDLISAAVTFTIIIIGLMVFVIISAFPFILEAFGMHWCIWIYSVGCFIGAFLIYWFLPETRGKNIADILEILRKY